jgi:glycerate dehydrogenase
MSEPRIVVIDGQTLNPGDNPWSPLERLGQVQVYPRSAPAEIVPRCRDADVVVVNKARLSRDTLSALSRLRLVAVSASGYDCVDAAAARELGIAVCRVPEYGTAAVAQFTWALLLELCHRVGTHDAAVHAGRWAQAEDFCFWLSPQVELAGLTLGVVGLGRIGRRVADLGHAFGMEVLAANRNRGAPPNWQPFSWADVDELFERADVVTLHCPLTPETAGLVHRQRLARMKPPALLVNTARGGLVVEADLAEALRAGRLAGAALDVVSAEPIDPANPLLSAPNCLLTPHIAWASLAARRRLLHVTAANVAAFLAGRPQNLVAP